MSCAKSARRPCGERHTFPHVPVPLSRHHHSPCHTKSSYHWLFCAFVQRTCRTPMYRACASHIEICIHAVNTHAYNEHVAGGHKGKGRKIAIVKQNEAALTLHCPPRQHPHQPGMTERSQRVRPYPRTYPRWCRTPSTLYRKPAYKGVTGGHGIAVNQKRSRSLNMVNQQNVTHRD